MTCIPQLNRSTPYPTILMKLSIPLPILTRLPRTPLLGLAFLVPIAASHAAVVAEIEGNNLASTAQFVSPFSFTAESVTDITLSTSTSTRAFRPPVMERLTGMPSTT